MTCEASKTFGGVKALTKRAARLEFTNVYGPEAKLSPAAQQSLEGLHGSREGTGQDGTGEKEAKILPKSVNKQGRNAAAAAAPAGISAVWWMLC